MTMNKSILSNCVCLTVGAAIGSLVTWKVVKTKYDQIIQEEIDSVRETFRRIEENKEQPSDDFEDEEEEEEDDDEGDIQEYEEIIRSYGYVAASENMRKKEEKDMSKPYVITPEEFGDNDYPTISLNYFEGDDVLTDDHNKMIKNVDELVGEDFASHFGEYEMDSVFIRNDELGIDYEILKDFGSFSEIS